MNIQATATLSLLDVAAGAGGFSIFNDAIDRAGLRDELDGPGPFTVFAPTDDAFDKLPAGRLDALFRPENRNELASLLNYHVVNGRRSLADIATLAFTNTRNGKAARISRVDGTTRIDGAQVIAPDIASSNGVIHGIDQVNSPSALFR